MSAPRRDGGPPALSVVIICFTSAAHLRRALQALEEQTGGVPIEILVPHDDTLTGAEALALEFPAARFMRGGATVTPAALRTQGTRAATAPIVGFLEDHCMPARDWAARVLAAHRQPHAGIGGSIEKGFKPGRSTDTALNWAIYFTDYSRYMLPMAEGPAHGLSDCNVSYKRPALDRIGDVWAAEFHENLVNGRLAAAGETLWFDPAMTVFEQRDLTLAGAVSDRFSFGRLFGSSRVREAPLVRRLIFSASALVMPPLLVARVANNLVSRRRHLGQLVRCLPHLVVVASMWMAGESLGYLTGTAGKRLSHDAP
jgi:hypothetical protein